MADDLLLAALARPDLSAPIRAYLLDVQRSAAWRPLTARQKGAVARIATAPPRPNYSAINAAAIARLPDVVARLLPGGRRIASHWHAGSLRGEAGDSLRVRLVGERAGAWKDFATGDAGGDPVSLAAAVEGVLQDEGARRLSRMLGMEGTRDDR